MSKKIVIVDDDPILIEKLTQFLSRSKQFEISSFENPEVALPRVKNNEFDLVLLDVVMPQMSGVEFLTELKKSQCNVKVIVMTATSTLDIAIECDELGADDYVTKPFISFTDVENKVMDNLNL